MKLAASKVDFRIGCVVGVEVVLVVPDGVVLVVGVVEWGDTVVVLAVELVGNGVGPEEQDSVVFKGVQPVTVELCEQ